MSDPTDDDRTAEGSIDEDRDISDVGLAHEPDVAAYAYRVIHLRDDVRTGQTADGSDADEAALDEVFPPADDPS